MQIKKELQKNKQVMQEAFRDCGDIIMREFRILTVFSMDKNRGVYSAIRKVSASNCG